MAVECGGQRCTGLMHLYLVSVSGSLLHSHPLLLRKADQQKSKQRGTSR